MRLTEAMRWPLRYQILLPFAGVMLAVVVSVSLLDAYLAARRTQHQIVRQLRAVAETLLDANFPLTDAVLKQTRGLSGAEFVLVDQQGHLEASSLPSVDPASIPRPGQLREHFELDEPIRFADQSYFHTAIAVRPRGSTPEPLQLHILYPVQQLQDARWQAAYPALLIGTVLLVVVIVLAIVIAGRLSAPILELRRELSRLVRGQFRPLPVPQRNDELRDLVTSVNQLGDELDELRRAIKRSERLSLLGQLSGGLAHQLRNSAAGARLAIQLHQRHCQNIDQDSLAVAVRQLSLTESHLQRFLTAGQPTALRRAPCSLAQVCADVLALALPACKHRGVTIEIVGADETELELIADQDQLRQMLMNLVLNAVEAAGIGGWVRIEPSATSTACRLAVFDSGPGPSDELAERLFEPFATGKPEGIGLGLTVARKIAEAHGGSLRYSRGSPTCFEVILPRETDNCPALRISAELPSVGAAST